MTFEDFKELALNPPHYQGETICRLDVYCYSEEWGDMSDGSELHHGFRGYYLTSSEANGLMPQVYESLLNEGFKIYCAIITELPTNVNMFNDKPVSIKVYDESANLIEHTLCSNLRCDNEPTEIFRRRIEHQMRFKPGDIVEVLEIWAESPATIKTAIITATPPSVERCWELKYKLPDDLYLGFEDDVYEFITWNPQEANISSAHPVYLFKPRFPISEQRMNELNEWFGYATENPDKILGLYKSKKSNSL